MKKFSIEVNYTLTAYVEVEADTEDEAVQQAYKESDDMKVGDLKEWSSETEIKSVTERCDYCCKDFDVDIEPLVDYQGGRYCPECKDELEHADD